MNICLICAQEFLRKRKEQVFCSTHCRQKSNGKGRKGQLTGLQSKPYKMRLTKDGYFRMYAAKHPYANGRKEIHVHVHVMVMEIQLNRAITPGECVHHINGIKTDNRLENLQLMSHSEHSRAHNQEISMMRKRVGGRFA